MEIYKNNKSFILPLFSLIIMQDKTNESYYTCQTVHSNKKAIKQMINNKQNNNNKKIKESIILTLCK